MAAQITPCSSSSSSSSRAFPSEFKPRKCCFFKRVSQVCPIIHTRNHFQIKSSNGHPLNAVSSQGGFSFVLEPSRAFRIRYGWKSFGQSNQPCRRRRRFFHRHLRWRGSSLYSQHNCCWRGDLAKKKIFPALFALYYEDWLPEMKSSGI